jgi:tRNA threonylcarbamoyladenosine biosynthesis protein TsaB
MIPAAWVGGRDQRLPAMDRAATTEAAQVQRHMAKLHWRPSMDAILLALDSSTDQVALALVWPGGELTRMEPGGALASTRLIPAIQDLLVDAGLPMAQLTGIAFGAGPGAFTGLRTACAAAQGLALGLGLPVLPLDSLMLVAEDAIPNADSSEPIWVAVDARMDEIYAASYARHADGRWCVQSPPALYGWQTLAKLWREAPPRRVAGNALEAFAGRLPIADGLYTPHERDRAAALGRLARLAWTDQRAIDPALALPMYLRDKVAQTTAEHLAARSAATA